MKYLTVLIIFLYCQASWSIFIGTELPSEAPEYQCQIVKHDKDLKRDLTICSGTYINKNVFLTAAHCFDVLSYGDRFLDGIEYYISCKSGINKVHAVAVHPFYKADYQKALKFDSSILELPPSVDTGFYLSLTYNDIALVYSDSVNFKEFPTINSNPKAEYKEDSCHSLGFSPHNCNLRTGKGCYKSKVSIKKSNPEKKLHSCNLVTGESCFASDSEKDKLPFFYTSDTKKFAKGDSGAGLLCLDKQTQKEVLAGIKVSDSEEQEIVSIANKYEFINKFINLSFDDFKQQANNINFDKRIEQSLVTSWEIERLFMYKVRVKINSSHLDATQVLVTDLYNELKNEESIIRGYFGSNKINNIIFDKHSFYRIKDVNILIKKFGNMTELIIHPQASIQDVIIELSQSKL